jgi:3-hydroxy-D-aspartate aldolase
MDFETLDVGYDIPARPGQRIDEVLTPALVIDLDRFERNLGRMRNFIARTGLRCGPMPRPISQSISP